jgi:phosphotransacetylase
MPTRATKIVVARAICLVKRTFVFGDRAINAVPTSGSNIEIVRRFISARFTK